MVNSCAGSLLCYRSSPAKHEVLQAVVVDNGAEGSKPKPKKGWFRRQSTEPDTKAEPAVDVSFWRLVKYNKPEWPYAVLGSVASIGIGGAQPAFAFLFVAMITVFYDPALVREKSSFYSWMFFVVACGMLLCNTVQQWSFGVMGQRLARRIRVMLFGAMLRQEIG